MERFDRPIIDFTNIYMTRCTLDERRKLYTAFTFINMYTRGRLHGDFVTVYLPVRISSAKVRILSCCVLR